MPEELKITKSDGVFEDGSYDLESLKAAESAMGDGDGNTSGMVDVDPMYIPVITGRAVARIEEYEARMVIIEYDAFDNIIGVELL